MNTEDNEDRFRHFRVNAKLQKNFVDGSTLYAGILYHNFHPAYKINYVNPGTYKDFSYDQNNVDAYIQYQRSFNQYISLQAGLRWQYYNFDMYQKPTNKRYRNIYQDFLPSVSVGINLPNGNHAWSIEYSRYVVTPNSGNLDPTLTFSTENTASMGNPYLKSYTNEYGSIRYVLYRHIAFIPNFVIGKNYFFDPVVDGDVTISMPKIDGRLHFLGLPVEYFNDFFGIWQFKVNFSTFYTHVKSKIDPSVGYAKWNIGFGVYNRIQFIPNKPFFATINYHFRRKNKEVKSITDAGHYLSLGTEAKLKFGGVIYVNINNILNTRQDSYYNSPEYSYYSHQKNPGISISVGFRYQFGNLRVHAANNRIEK